MNNPQRHLTAFKDKKSKYVLTLFRLVYSFVNALSGAGLLDHSGNNVGSLSAKGCGCDMHSLEELHIILVAEIQLQHFLQRLVTFSEITQINQYAGFTALPMRNHALQILKGTGMTDLLHIQEFTARQIPNM